ncbi:hypothetical protein F5X96DRAFT_13316 [Biscogniauxia mediterranea]|nr:hypothetical protein F5X96DRAFT_13316 [Biscogniauxia mediterranea]
MDVFPFPPEEFLTSFYGLDPVYNNTWDVNYFEVNGNNGFINEITYLPPPEPGQQQQPKVRIQGTDSSGNPFKCDQPECSKLGWSRVEHLKRHQSICHSQNPPSFRCSFCPKTFNRADNFRAHLRLHTRRDAGPKARAKFHPDAPAAYEKLMREWEESSKGRKTTSRNDKSDAAREAGVADYSVV